MILLDTCAIIWDALDKTKLTAKAKKAINKADKARSLFISDISIWELAMLVKRKRVEIDDTSANFTNLYLQTRNIEILQITPEIAELSVNFGAEINNDPADRLISATSIIENLSIVTSDRNLRNSDLLNTTW